MPKVVAHIGQIAMSDVCAPVSACDGGGGQVVEDGTQSDRGVRCGMGGGG